MRLLRKFWGREKRFFVISTSLDGSQGLRIVERYKSAKVAEQVKDELNAQQTFAGPGRLVFRVREL